jgi:membrane fusion protein (multidrug efflux system)
MRVDSIPDQAFAGRIQRISPVVDSTTGTFRVTCEFRDASRRLKSGMFGRLEIVYAQHDDVLTIPRAALIEEDGETAVFQVVAASSLSAEDKEKLIKAKQDERKEGETKAGPGKDKPLLPAFVAKRRLIKVGYGDSGFVEILDGLAEGDRVVTLGRSAVRDGTAVQVLEGVQ